MDGYGDFRLGGELFVAPPQFCMNSHKTYAFDVRFSSKYASMNFHLRETEKSSVSKDVQNGHCSPKGKAGR